MNRVNGRRFRRFRAVRRVLDSMARMRHFRGHGVHSPFVYSLVRNVFMRDSVIESGDLSLFDTLKSRVDMLFAVKLQNLSTICGYKSYAVDPEEITQECELVIYTTQLSLDELMAVMAKVEQSGATIAISTKRDSMGAEELYNYLDDNHKSTLLKKRDYLLIFNNHLPKQRYIL